MHRKFLAPEIPRVLLKSAVLALLMASAAPHAALAHGDVHLQIERLTSKIKKAPSAELFVKRGDLYRLDENHEAALADLARAEKLNPSLDSIFLCRGRTLFEAARHREAIEPLDHLLAHNPDHPDGRMIRARAHAALGEPASALKDYDHLVAVMPSPSPDCFLERAAALTALKKPQVALRGLDEGISRLGNLQPLQLAALEIEIGRKQYDAALSRTERAMAPLQRKEQWLTRRGEILQAAGRTDEAKAAYAAALASIEALPRHHRSAKPTRELEARLHTLLGAPSPESPSKNKRPSRPE